MTGPVAFWASQPHYADHLRPIWEALDPELRGTWWPPHRIPELAALTVVASAGDAIVLGRRPVVLVEHGAGQAYPGTDNPSYSGGSKRDNVVLFLCPNEVSAGRNRAAYPEAAVEVVGSPRLDALAEWAGCAASVEGDGVPASTVALTHHWDCCLVPETRWAQPHFIRAYPDLAERFHVLGHGHPRYRFALGAVWHRLGIEHACRQADPTKTCGVISFEDVVRRARVLVADNTSAGFEWMALGRPLVWLSPPWYRRTVVSWPRFWRATEGLPHATEPEHLIPMVERAMADPPEDREARRTLVEEVYTFLGDGLAAKRSAYAIEAVLRRVRSAA